MARHPFVRTGRSAPAALLTLRTVASAHALAILAQPVWAGHFLAGNYAMLHAHFVGANVVFYAGLAQPLAAGWLGLARGPRWPLITSLAVAVAEYVQFEAGMTGALDLHLPLGVALAIAASWLAVALFRSSVPDTSAARSERGAR